MSVKCLNHLSTCFSVSTRLCHQPERSTPSSPLLRGGVRTPDLRVTAATWASLQPTSCLQEDGAEAWTEAAAMTLSSCEPDRKLFSVPPPGDGRHVSFCFEGGVSWCRSDTSLVMDRWTSSCVQSDVAVQDPAVWVSVLYQVYLSLLWMCVCKCAFMYRSIVSSSSKRWTTAASFQGWNLDLKRLRLIIETSGAENHSARSHLVTSLLEFKVSLQASVTPFSFFVWT